MPFNDVTFFFLISYTLNAFIDVSEIQSEIRGKNYAKMCLKMGMLAPGYGLLLVHVSFRSVYKGFKLFNIKNSKFEHV